MFRTLPSTFARRLGANLLAALALIVGMFVLTHVAQSTYERPAAERPAAHGSDADLYARHGGPESCWTLGQTALAEVPGHVIASVGAGDPHYYGPEVTGQALDQLFAGKDHHLAIAYFCK